MIELVNVSKIYDHRTVVDAINVGFDPGKNHVLIGPSGCRKSTILKLLIGLVKPDHGQVLLDGNPLIEQNISQTRKRFGYVIQTGGLFPHLTARENIELPAKWHRWSESDIILRTEKLAALTRFPVDGLDRYPSQLSGGQRQRVGLMRALILEPDVLLLDEPLGALDPMIRNQLQKDLLSIFRSLQKTVVMVTHDLHEAVWFADEILLMQEGRIRQRGTIDQLINEPAEPFVTDFVQAQQTHLPVARNQETGPT